MGVAGLWRLAWGAAANVRRILDKAPPGRISDLADILITVVLDY